MKEKPLFLISDKSELNALLKTILVVKFETPLDDPDVNEICSSPIVAELSHRIYDALTERVQLEEDHQFAAILISTRVADLRIRELEVVKGRLRTQLRWWMDLEQSRKIEHLFVLLSPYRPSDQCVTELLAAFEKD